MDHTDFYEWLMKEKAMSQRSARDVLSRLRRVDTFLGNKGIDEYSLEALEAAPAFVQCSMFIKSQLRRTIRLFNEFSGKK